MLKTKNTSPEHSKYAEKKMQEMFTMSGPIKAQKSKISFPKSKNLPKIPKSKISTNLNLEPITPLLPDLGCKSTKYAPDPITPKKIISNSKSPASPPTCKKITLENMLFGEEPKEVDPDLVELMNHESTKCSVK